MKKFISGWLCLLFILGAASLRVPTAAAAAVTPTNFTDQLLAGGLNQPTDMAFAPDGRVLVTLLGGQVLIYKNSQILTTPALSLNVGTGGDRGLLSVTLDPQFSTNNTVYLLYTSTALHERISKFTLSGDVINPASEQVILENSATWGGFLNAGALRFGPDGKLYATMGSDGGGTIAQDLSSMNGKMLRINSDGTMPADNPFVNTPGAQKSIYAIGFRNPWRFNFDHTGRAIVGDVGQSLYEKVVRVTSGANFGWPTFEGDCSPNCNGVTPPLLVIPHNGQGTAVLGGDENRSSNFPASYSNNYFFGDYVQGTIKNFGFDANNNPTAVQSFATAAGVLSALDFNPVDGCLWYTDIFPGELHKICYNGTIPVTVTASANKTSGALPLTVQFSSTGSTGTNLAYSWNFGDGGSSTLAAPAHTFTVKGTYKVTLAVSGTGGVASTSITIRAGYLTPAVTITAPVQGGHYSGGDVIHFAGTATDPQDGTLPASAFAWKVIPHHNIHVHAPAEFAGVASGNFTIPVAGEPGADTWYEFQAAVSDSAGLVTTSSVSIYPNLANLTINTNPAGLQILLDGVPFTAPHTELNVVNMNRTIAVASPQASGGTNYAFSNWSDGGAISHQISVPVATSTFLATFAASAPTGPNIVMINGYPTINGNYIDCNGNIDNDQGHHTTNPADNDPAHHIGQNCPVGTLVYNFLNSTPPPPPPTPTSTPSSTPPANTVFTLSAVTDASTYAPGATAKITSTAGADHNAAGLLLDAELWSGGVKVLQNVTPANLVANSPTNSLWTLSAPATAGVYNVKLGLFSSDWGKLYSWNDNAASFSVGNTPPPPPVNPLFVVSATMPSAVFNPGAATTLTTNVAATGDLPNVVIDTEIADANGTLVLQKVTSANLLANQLSSNVWNLTLPNATGTYTVKVGIFSSDWTKLYYWGNRTLQFSVGAPPSGPQPGVTYPITVLQPTSGAHVTGTVEIRAGINGLDINTYTISWRTGNSGPFFPLDTDPVTLAYKHTWIDFSTWNWIPSGNYPIAFQATDLSNNIIGSGTITVVH